MRDPHDPDACPRFHPIDPPTDDEVAHILAKVARRVHALLVKTGRLLGPRAPEATAPEPASHLAACLAEALAVPSRRRAAPVSHAEDDALTARCEGFSLLLSQRIADRHPRARSLTVLTVGGLFDFVSGRIPRAPQAWREAGLEWVYRLLQEPRRMSRRYLLGNPLFLLRAVRQKLLGPTR